LVYIDETGSVGKAVKKQPLPTLAAVLVDEDKVRPLTSAFQKVAWDHFGSLPGDFAMHGHEVWGGTGHWKGKLPDELVGAYEQAISVLEKLEIASMASWWSPLVAK
jgi:hypothetical protein